MPEPLPDLSTPEARRACCQTQHVGPSTYFSWASSETRGLFINGYFYACIVLVQSVAEGLGKYLARMHQLPIEFSNDKGYQGPRLEALKTQNCISQAIYDAFQVIHDDRNDYHHMNSTVPSDMLRLVTRAKECMDALYRIESELFATDFSSGKLTPRNPIYWTFTSTGDVQAFIKSSSWD